LRGVKPPSLGTTIALGKDPSFEEIEAAGGAVFKSDQPHAVLDDMFLISGEIPRVTPYEKGLKYGVRLQEKLWIDDSLMEDERLLMCKVKGKSESGERGQLMLADASLTGKGIVVFTGCSHAGVVNASRHALELGGGTPLYAVMGGYHLADAEATNIQSTAADLKALNAQILLTGHCTGWRAKFEIERQMPGRLVPSFVGSKFTI
jgi:7,8-dihydropterin-6-yl-methyl-4-(beta-D-ribofuranosyl)aminobenzene 5'-phosphate synthase